MVRCSEYTPSTAKLLVLAIGYRVSLCLLSFSWRDSIMGRPLSPCVVAGSMSCYRRSALSDRYWFSVCPSCGKLGDKNKDSEKLFDSECRRCKFPSPLFDGAYQLQECL